MSTSTDVTDLTSIPLAEIEAAQERIKGHVVRTPLLKLNYDVKGAEVCSDIDLYLIENHEDDYP